MWYLMAPCRADMIYYYETMQCRYNSVWHNVTKIGSLIASSIDMISYGAMWCTCSYDVCITPCDVDVILYDSM